MNFKRELAEKVMCGEKTVTRRGMSPNPRSPWWEGGCKLIPGRDYAVCPGRGKDQVGRVRVLKVDAQTLGQTFSEFGQMDLIGWADLEARREGFRDAVSFQLGWLRINKTYRSDTRVWRVEFEVVR